MRRKMTGNGIFLVIILWRGQIVSFLLGLFSLLHGICRPLLHTLRNDKIQIVAEQAADWLPDKAQTAFAAMLQAHPDIKMVYASNDMMAAGALLAAKGAGREVKIIGTDGLPGPAGGIEAVAKEDWSATFTYPTGGKEAIDMAKSILLDCAESVPAIVTVDTTAITSENAKSMMGN